MRDICITLKTVTCKPRSEDVYKCAATVDRRTHKPTRAVQKEGQHDFLLVTSACVCHEAATSLVVIGVGHIQFKKESVHI
jgi:chorismate synthase